MAGRFNRNGNGGGGGTRTEEKKKPVYSRQFYIGGSYIDAAVWEKEVGEDKRLTYSVTVSRSYKDGEEWKRSDSFWPQDLPALSLAVQDCAMWISNEEARR